VLVSGPLTVANGHVSGKSPPGSILYSYATGEKKLHKRSLVKLFTQFKHIVHTHNVTLTMDISNLWKHCYRFTHAFFTLHKTTCLSAISRHRHAALHSKMSAFNSHMRQNICHCLKWTFEELLLCYCYAIKNNDKTIQLPVSQPASAGKRADMGEMQAHHCLKPE